MQLLMLIISECLLILKEKTKKTKFNFNIKNILLHWSITFPSYPDLGKKVGNLDFGGGSGGWGVFCNFGFGLRKKSWKFGLGGYSVTGNTQSPKIYQNFNWGGIL